MQRLVANHVIEVYEPLFTAPIEESKEYGRSRPFPTIAGDAVFHLIEEAIAVFKTYPNVLHIEGPIYIVGDLHGNIIDLLRILSSGGHPSETKYLFLGDYVDRGQYSVEVITLLMALAIKYPENVFLLRGNHEFEETNSKYGFKEQVLCLYGNLNLFYDFQNFFVELPLAAVVNKVFFCVHGGLSPHLVKLSDIDKIDRRADPPPPILRDIMWSDPVSGTQEFTTSNRGVGVDFGILAIHPFLKENSFKRIIRAHQFTVNGIHSTCDGKVLTVFSTCNYKAPGSNKCGLVRVTGERKQDVEAFHLPNIDPLDRNDASFFRPFYSSDRAQKKIRCIANVKKGHTGSHRAHLRAMRKTCPIVAPVLAPTVLKSPVSPQQIKQTMSMMSDVRLTHALSPSPLKTHQSFISPTDAKPVQSLSLRECTSWMYSE